MDDDKKKRPDDSGGENFNYEDLINEYSTKSEGDNATDLSGLDFEKLMKETGQDATESAPDGGGDEIDLTNIFDGLDDLARKSILTDGPADDSIDSDRISAQDADTEAMDYSFGEFHLDDESEGGYASLLSQIEKGGTKENPPAMKDISKDMESESDFSIDLDLLGGTGRKESHVSSPGEKNTETEHSGISFDFDETTEPETVSITAAGEETVEIDFSFDLKGFDEENHEAESLTDSESSAYASVDDAGKAGDLTTGSDYSDLLSGFNDANDEKTMTDTEAVEGVLTGEFSIDYVNLTDIVGQQQNDTFREITGITMEHLAFKDEYESGREEKSDSIADETLDIEVVVEDKSVSDKSSYAAALADFVNKTTGGSSADGGKSESSEADYIELDSDEKEEPDGEGLLSAVSVVSDPENTGVGGGEENAEEIDFTGGDLFAEDETQEEAVKPVQPPKAEKKAAEADDFLGLGAIAAVGTDESGGRFGGTVDILFEGVEMDFDEQVSYVTLAEVLIAQGKQDKAEALLNKVVAGKGVTHWVTKRLNKLHGAETH